MDHTAYQYLNPTTSAPGLLSGCSWAASDLLLKYLWAACGLLLGCSRAAPGLDLCRAALGLSLAPEFLLGYSEATSRVLLDCFWSPLGFSCAVLEVLYLCMLLYVWFVSVTLLIQSLFRAYPDKPFRISSG